MGNDNLKIENYKADLITEDEEYFINLRASLDKENNELYQYFNEQHKAINKLSSLEENFSNKLRKLEDIKKKLLDANEKKIKVYEDLKSANKTIIELKKNLQDKEIECHRLNNYIMEYKQDIDALHVIRDYMEAKYKAEIARLEDLLGKSKASNNSQIPGVDISNAIAEYKKQNELSQQQIKVMTEQINTLRDKLGNKTIPLSSLADGIKRYAEIYGLKEGKELLKNLSILLKKEHVWTDNVESLEDFFIEAEKENRQSLLTLENKDPGGIIQQTDKPIVNVFGDIEKGDKANPGDTEYEYDEYEEVKNNEDTNPTSKRGRPKKAGKKLMKSFLYQAYDNEETNQRLQSLYYGLLQLQWIAADTKQKSFMSIFSGEDTTCRITWIGDINTLAELFKELVTRKGFVKLPEGESIWVMVNARFWEKEGNHEFGNDRLRSTSTPTASKDMIDLLVKWMDPDLPLESLKEAIQTQR